LRENLLKRLERGIREYNKYRSPEAIARLAEYKNDKFVVRFEGTFTTTCGNVDWLADLVYVLEDMGIKTKLVDYRSIGDYCMEAVYHIEEQ
jgi:hypothetical protein